MPGYLFHVGATAQCTHAATATTTPKQTRVLVGGQPVATASNQTTVAGCPFQVPVGAGTKPQPCVKIQWTMTATRVQVNGEPPVLQPGPGSGVGACQSAEQIPQGPPTISQLQQRVSGI
jgi:hypothetical protein